MKKNISNQKGFTIVELMIATMIFSGILMVCIGGFVYVGKMFYKGITISKTMENARTITDTILDDIRTNTPASISTPTPISGLQWFCIGSHIYSFKPGEMYDGTTSTWGFQQETLASIGAPCVAPASGTNQMLDPRMRVSYIDFDSTTCSSSGYCPFTLKLASGDDVTFGGSPIAQSRDITCNGTLSDTQFCDVAVLDTGALGLAGKN